MRSVADIYTDEIYNLSKKYHGSWYPNAQFALGDFGTLEAHRFVYQGNAGRRLGLAPNIWSGTSDANNHYTSEGTVEIGIDAGAGGTVNPGVKIGAKLNISFGSQEAIFFNAAGLKIERFDDMIDVGNQLIDLYKKGAWRSEWCIVTEIVHSTATTVAVAQGVKASAVLEADGEVPKINLADASLRLQFATANQVSFQMPTQNELTPLIELRGLQFAGIFNPQPTELVLKAARAMQEAEGAVELSRL